MLTDVVHEFALSNFQLLKGRHLMLQTPELCVEHVDLLAVVTTIELGFSDAMDQGLEST